jgi:exonuclease III
MTWNLNKRDALLKIIAEHVARRCQRQEPFIVAVQECMDDHEAIVGMVNGFGGDSVHATGNGTMSVLCSEPLEPTPIPSDTVGGRLLLTRATFGEKRVAIVNFHGPAQGCDGSPHLTERGGIASEARWRIDSHAGHDPVIVLGDFNALPTDPELTSAFCFSFALEPNPASKRSHDRERQDVRMVRVESPQRGTHFYQSGSQGRLWQDFDFLAATRDLVREARALDELDGASLVVDGRLSVGDHLPVAATMELT